MKKAIVHFKDGHKSTAIVNASYSKGGIHYYDLTLNKIKSFIEFVSGERKLYKGEEITSLTYIMS